MPDRKKKILLASPLPPPYSGYEKITQCILASELSQKFNIIHVNTSNNRGVDVRGMFDTANLLMSIRHLRELFFALVIHRPEVANIPIARNRTGFLKYSLYILLAASFRCRIVVRFGGDHFDVFYDQSSAVFQKYIRFVIKKADIMIVEADRLNEQFRGLIDLDKIRTVYLGLDVGDNITSIAADSDNNPEREVNVLFLGYISKAKGAIDLLESVSSVVSKDDRIRFDFAGPVIKQEKNILHIDNPVNTEVEIHQIFEKDGCRDYVRFWGEVTGDAKAEAFRTADIFVMPSYSESGPFVVLEAMAAGLPLITTRVGVLPEVLEDGKNTFFVNTGAPEELAEKILILADDRRLRMDMGKANRQLVEKTFSMNVFTERMEKIYNEV